MAKPTRFGGNEPQMHIFQDDFFDNSAPMMNHAPMPPVARPARRPLQSSQGNVVLNPPSASSTRQSPFKSTTQTITSPLTPLKASQNNKLNTVSIMPPTHQMQTTDSMQKKQPLMSRFKTVAQKPLGDMPAQQYMGKENSHPMIYPAPPTPSLSFENYYQKPSGKRVLLEPAPIKEARPEKKQKLDDAPLPSPDSFPPIADDGTKPGHSYATLIGMAILRAPNRRLTLSQIYKWISDTYSFYSAQDAGWQNSIRHNLSLNKNFIKQERPKDDPGKGNYWAIEPGMEHIFIKEKPVRKSTSAAENLPVMSTRLEPSQPIQPISAVPLPEPTLPPQLPTLQPSLPNIPPSQPSAPLQQEPSSDATIPASDNVLPEDGLAKSFENDGQLDSGFYSPVPATMHSSPPIPRHVEIHNNTPPRVTKAAAGSSATRSHKRKFASMDDSGYISSLDSSIIRPSQAGRLLTSEADRPRIKRGRAEEEIARLRASSYDSPTKGRSWNGFAPPSSSPLRQNSSHESHQMLPPLTPALKLKAPPKPPPSVSPNTNLKLHRDKVRSMLQSPLRRVSNMGDMMGEPRSYSPNPTTYDLFDRDFVYGETCDHFDIFNDGSAFLGNVENGSPEKRSAKRARLDRAHSASILTEITNSHKSITSAPFLKVPGQSPAVNFETPSKVFDGLSSPSKLLNFQSPSKVPLFDDSLANIENTNWMLDDFCTTEFLDDPNDFSGLDILQGFEKIGGGSQPARTISKPAFGRSYTSTF